MNKDDQRFGMPQSAFDSALKSHGKDSPVIRLGMYVPTRREVATLPIKKLSAIVIDWLWESPSELIPNNDQIEELRAILTARSDAKEPAVLKLLSECDEYLKI